MINPPRLEGSGPSPHGGRLSYALRALAFFPLMIFTAAIVTGSAVGAFALATHTPVAAALNKVMLSNALAPNLVMAVAVVTATYLMYRLFTRTGEHDSVLTWNGEAIRQGATGMWLGAGAQALVVVLGLATGVYRMTWNWPDHADGGRWLLYALTMLLVAVQEEAIFRGYLLQSLSKSVGRAAAAVLLAVLFAAAHLHQPGMGAAALIGLAWHALVYAYAVFQASTVWQAVGLHWAWNVCEGIVFGLPNSGVSERFSLWATAVTGPMWWTGGSFGPEAGLLSAIAFAMVCGMIYVMAKRRRSVSMRAPAA